MVIGNYRFYPAFFVIFILLPSILIFIGYFLYDMRANKKYHKLNRIKGKYISLSKSVLKENLYYEELIYFLENNSEFAPEESLGYGDDFVAVVTKDLFKHFLTIYENDVIKATNILTLMDSLNVELNYEKSNIDWIGDDVEREMYFISMNEYDAKLENLFITSIDNKINLIEEGKMTISANTSVYPKLRQYSIHDMNDLVAELIRCKDMYSLDEELRLFITYCLIDDINKGLKLFDSGLLNSIRVYKIRALACILNNKSYDKIILDKHEAKRKTPPKKKRRLKLAKK